MGLFEHFQVVRVLPMVLAVLGLFFKGLPGRVPGKFCERFRLLAKLKNPLVRAQLSNLPKLSNLPNPKLSQFLKFSKFPKLSKFLKFLRVREINRLVAKYPTRIVAIGEFSDMNFISVGRHSVL